MVPKFTKDHVLANLNRIGLVSQVLVDQTGVFVKVSHQAQRGKVSGWLPVLQGNTKAGGNIDYWTPQVGEQVAVSYLSSGLEDGICHGSFFNKHNPPPTTNQQVQVEKKADGTIFTYDNGAKQWTIAAQGKVNLSTLGDVTLSCGGNLMATVVGSTTIKSAGLLTLDADVKITKTLTVEGVVDFQAGGKAEPHITNTDGTGGGS